MEINKLKLIPAIIFSPISSLTKIKTSTILEDRDIIIKAYKEGLYHITLEENVDSIIESKLMKASNAFTSYGNKKCFFFAGIPSYETAAMNIDPDIKLTALKLNLTYEQLTHFKYRSANDKSIVYDGNLDLNDVNVEKIRLGLTTKNGDFAYKIITDEEYQSYKPNITQEQLNLVNDNLRFKLNSYMVGLNRELDLLKNQVVIALKDERTAGSLVSEINIEDNQEEFISKIR